MARKAAFYIAVGTNGTGKTVDLKKFLPVNSKNIIFPANRIDDAWDEIPEKVIDFKWIDDPNTFNVKMIQKYDTRALYEMKKGNRKIFLDYNDKKTLKAQVNDIINIDILPNGRKAILNCGLFFDDYKNMIITKGTIPGYMRQVFNDRRHNMVDIFMATHGFNDINADFIPFGPTLIIKKTTMAPSKLFLDRIERPEELLRTIDTVNRTAEKGGKNQYYSQLFELT